MKRRRFIQNSGLHASALALGSTLSSWGEVDSKPKEKIKIGQIGVCHEHAGGRMNSLKMLSEHFDIVGVVDDRASKAARFAGHDLKPFEGLPWMKENELFKVPGLQAVMVETANGDLVPTAIRCMERGLAVSMDKPGGEDLALYKKLLDGCEKKNLPFQIAYMFRGNPAFQFCQEALRKNWLGDVFEIQADMNHDYGGNAYQQYLSHYQGGIMYNLGCHHIDFVVSLLGRPNQVVPILTSAKGAENGVKNNATTILLYPHTQVIIRACDQEPNGIGRRQLKISGNKGRIELSPLERFDGKPLTLKLILKEGNDTYEKGTHTVEVGIQKDRYVDQLREFAALIRGELQSPYTYAHDFTTQEVHLAASGYQELR